MDTLIAPLQPVVTGPEQVPAIKPFNIDMKVLLTSEDTADAMSVIMAWHKPGEGPPDAGAMRDNVALAEKPLKFLFAPPAPKRLRVHGREGGGVRRPRIGDHGSGAREQPVDEPHHRRGS